MRCGLQVSNVLGVQTAFYIDYLSNNIYDCLNVSITVWKTRKYSRHYTPLYAILNSMENLRFDKEDYFHVLVFYTGYFIKEIFITTRRQIICRLVPYVIKILVEV